MLAIVIPYYNYKYFKETLDSLASQSNKTFKVYIGDDASPVNPEELLKKYEGTFDFKYYRFDLNLGRISLTKQWDRCIDLTGDETWIQILGDDDVLDKNCVFTFYKNLKEIDKTDCKVIRFASKYINTRGKSLKGYSNFFHPKIEKATDSYYRHFKGESRSSLSEYIFSRDSYSKNKFYNFPLAWHSDDKAWLEFSNFQYIYTINDSLVSVRVSKGSITGNSSNQSIKNEAHYLFFKDIIFNKLSYFNKNQKIEFILEYGIILIKQQKIDFKNTFFITSKLFKLRAFIPLIKTVRRLFIAKFR